MRLGIASVFIIFFLMAPSFSWSEDDVDYLELIKILIKDGNYTRAENLFAHLGEDEEKATVYALKAMVFLQKKNYEQAKTFFLRSLREEVPSETEIYLYLSEAELELGEISSALASINKVSGVWKEGLAFFILKAEIFWRMEKKLEAWKVLQVAERKKLSAIVIGKKRADYLIQEQLYLSAYDEISSLLGKKMGKRDLLALSQLFRQKKQYDLAIRLLQKGLFYWEKDPSLTLEIAQNYFLLQQNFSASLLVEESARVYPELAFEASEILRQTGQSYRSHYLNLLTLDPKKKLRQKMSLFLEEDNYSSLVALIPDLQREKMLEKEDIRYAVAFSLFQNGSFKKSQNYLNNISSDKLYGKAIELKREIQKCREDRWSCVESL